MLRPPHANIARIYIFLCIIGIFISSCSPINPVEPSKTFINNRQQVLATFLVTIPKSLPIDTSLNIEWINPIDARVPISERVSLEKLDDFHYQVDVPVDKYALLTYRYIIEGNVQTIETGWDGKPVPCRTFFITSHSRIQDNVIAFGNEHVNNPTGWIEGKITVTDRSVPPSDILINIAGIIGVSQADGSFHIRNIPTGTHNLTIYSPDGTITPIQQQAIIEDGTITPLNVEIPARKFVTATFILKTPQMTPAHANIRIFGSTTRLGNTHAGLFGGINPAPLLAPNLTRQSSDEWILVINLPAGEEIKYTYSLGDPVINAEQFLNNQVPFRTILVPQEDFVIEDKVQFWGSATVHPISVNFTPPPFTEDDDVIQVQVFTDSWSEPIPMWTKENGEFSYTYFPTSNNSGDIRFRFCRSFHCGLLTGETGGEFIGAINETEEPQELSVIGSSWINFQQPVSPTVVDTGDYKPEKSMYTTGIELSDSFRAGWVPLFPGTLKAIKELKANLIIIPVSATFRSADPVWLTSDLSMNPSSQFIRQMANQARNAGISVYLQPVVTYASTADSFWNTFSKNEESWDEWMLEISNFFHQVIFLAKEIQVDGVVIGDETFSMVLAQSTENHLLAGQYRSESKIIWDELIKGWVDSTEIPVYLGIRLNDLISMDASSIQPFDGIYLLDLGNIAIGSIEPVSFAEKTARTLDDAVFPIISGSKKKVLIGLDYPSTIYIDSVCTAFPSQCLSPKLLNFPAPIQPDLELSTATQTSLYNAVMPEIVKRDWIEGIVSRRYLIPGGYQDQSSSIIGKPASNVVWYWFTAINDSLTN
jgi:hypothetical protein